MNSLNPEVAEEPEKLIVYGGGKAVRNWESFDLTVSVLKNLKNDETLLVQSGKPVAVFKTHSMAPRVLISNAMLVPTWATPERFNDLESKGLTIYGQMTAGSWIYWYPGLGIMRHADAGYKKALNLLLRSDLKILA